MIYADRPYDRYRFLLGMTCRKLRNCIDVLEAYSKRSKLKEDAAYIRSEYMAYKTLVSDKGCV